MAAALASTKYMETLYLVECNIGREGAQLITQAVQQNNTINEVFLLDETITVQGAQLLFNSLSSRKDCRLVLHNSFENCLSFTGQEQLEISFDNSADVLDVIKEYVQEILS